MVSCGYHQAVCGVGLFHEGENRIQHTPDLADIVWFAAPGADSVKLIQQVNRSGPRDLVKKQPKLAGRLAEEAAEQCL